MERLGVMPSPGSDVALKKPPGLRENPPLTWEAPSSLGIIPSL